MSYDMNYERFCALFCHHSINLAYVQLDKSKKTDDAIAYPSYGDTAK